MKEKKYPVLEEEDGVGHVNEPVVGYAATGSGYVNTIQESHDELGIPVGTLGFYTDDPAVLDARIAEIEADLDEIEAGKEPSGKWMTSEQFDQELFQVFPWLR